MNYFTFQISIKVMDLECQNNGKKRASTILTNKKNHHMSTLGIWYELELDEETTDKKTEKVFLLINIAAVCAFLIDQRP